MKMSKGSSNQNMICKNVLISKVLNSIIVKLICTARSYLLDRELCSYELHHDYVLEPSSRRSQGKNRARIQGGNLISVISYRKRKNPFLIQIFAFVSSKMFSIRILSHFYMSFAILFSLCFLQFYIFVGSHTMFT